MNTRLVLIPSYNPGALLRPTVEAAQAAWPHVYVISDGSVDGSDADVRSLGARLFRLASNQGKGAAVLHGLRHARADGFTHALVMDADGQHPPGYIRAFMSASMARPDAMILGRPVFGPDAPVLRRAGRRIANAVARALTRQACAADCLFGFRVYPVTPLLDIMERTRWMRGFEFDAEALLRLGRMGTPAIELDVPVRYLAPAQGGVSHFRYGRDNLRLAWMFARFWRNGR